jgi:sigma-54-dependent transcriptional regulator
VVDAIIGESRALNTVRQQVERYGPMPWTILVQGETGTGKELVTRALHDAGPRGRHRLIVVNCATVPESLLENEFFGHVRGAFTGADRDQPGVFRAADGGTLVLDEIGELPLGLQAKLLRVLESSGYRPLGGTSDVRVDVRIVASTNRDLAQLVGEGRFRADLFYRLDVLRIFIPPIRDRREDILPIVRHFLDRFAPDRQLALDATATAQVLASSWPGNVRQLQHVLLRAILRCESELITAQDLGVCGAWSDHAPETSRARKGTLQSILHVVEGQMIRDTLDRHRGNKSSAARELGLTRRGLLKKLQRHAGPGDTCDEDEGDDESPGTRNNINT